MTVPGPTEINAAWMRLPAAERDRLGLIAVDYVFQGFVYGDQYVVMGQPQDRAVLDPAIRDAAADAENARLNELGREIEAALPDLFGPDGENPAWSENAGPVPTPAALAATAAEAAEKADYERRAQSLRIKLGRKGYRLFSQYGRYGIAKKATGVAETGILNIDEAEAWLVDRADGAGEGARRA